jgi:threonyl-tRNA synthetase
LPERFGLEYIGPDNKPHRPVMIHRAPLGSMERFIGILIEHFAGAFPLWLAPEQVRVLPISEKVNDYAATVLKALHQAGLRAHIDARPEKIGAKIRHAQIEKVPVMFVIGQKEADTNQVAYRDRAEGDQGAMPLTDAVAKVAAVNAARETPRPDPLPSAGDEEESEQHSY